MLCLMTGRYANVLGVRTESTHESSLQRETVQVYVIGHLRVWRICKKMDFGGIIIQKTVRFLRGSVKSCFEDLDIETLLLKLAL